MVLWRIGDQKKFLLVSTLNCWNTSLVTIAERSRTWYTIDHVYGIVNIYTKNTLGCVLVGFVSCL